MKANQACSWQSVPSDKAATHVCSSDQDQPTHTPAWLSKRSLLAFLRAKIASLHNALQEYGIFCCPRPHTSLSIFSVLKHHRSFLYLSIIDRTTNGNLYLQGLETGYQA